MALDPEEVRRRFVEELRAWADGPALGDVDAPSCVPVVLDAMRRRGVPAVRARVEGDAIVFDVAVPKGVG
jgi:hypothetical protein